MIHFLIFASTLTFFDFAIFCQFLLSNVYLKNGIFKTCFRQSAKSKMTIKTSIFKLRPLLHFLCLINSFYRRCVCCIHNDNDNELSAFLSRWKGRPCHLRAYGSRPVPELEDQHTKQAAVMATAATTPCVNQRLPKRSWEVFFSTITKILKNY